MTAPKRLSLPAFTWYARQLWWRTGPLVLAGPVLLLCCVWFAACVLRPLDERTAQAQRQLAASRGQAVAAPAAGSTEASSLARFYAGFPPVEASYDLIERIYAAAASQNLALDQGEYKLVHEADGKLSRVSMVLPVKGSYPKVRKFIAQAMREVPSLALDGVSFQRQRIDDAAVEAQVRLTIYVRRP